MNIIYTNSFLFFSILLISVPAFGDQDARYQEESEIQQPVNEASNASFDKRLPPVLPGEVINDGQGKTKVWSTAGSVSVAPPPEAPSAPQLPSNISNNNNIGGVIVDDRGIRRGHKGR